MFRKNLLKKMTIVLAMGALAFSLVACGDSDKETKTEAITTEAITTEAVTTEEITTEATTEAADTEENVTGDGDDTSGEVVLDEDGNMTLNDMTIHIPDNYEYSADDSADGSATFIDSENGGAIVIAVDNKNLFLHLR